MPQFCPIEKRGGAPAVKIKAEGFYSVRYIALRSSIEGRIIDLFLRAPETTVVCENQWVSRAAGQFFLFHTPLPTTSSTPRCRITTNPSHFTSSTPSQTLPVTRAERPTLCRQMPWAVHRPQYKLTTISGRPKDSTSPCLDWSCLSTSTTKDTARSMSYQIKTSAARFRPVRKKVCPVQW